MLYRLYALTIKPIISMLVGYSSTCRFDPTCGQYAQEAIKIHGFFTGSYLSIKRLVKCHPFHNGGYDPVPQKIIPSK